MKRRSWIIAYDATTKHGKEPYTMACLRCGSTVVPALPIAVVDYARLAKSFGRIHAKCR